MIKLAGVRMDYGADAVVATLRMASGELAEPQIPNDLLSHLSFLHGNYPMNFPAMGAQASAEPDFARPDDGA